MLSYSLPCGTVQNKTEPPSKNIINSLYINRLIDLKRETNMAKHNHSCDNRLEIMALINLEICTVINKDKCLCQNVVEKRSSYKVDDFNRSKWHKKTDVYGRELIIKNRIGADMYGGLRYAADLKFKCVKDAREWTEAVGRAMAAPARKLVAILVLLMLSTVASTAPVPSRSTRSLHIEKTARSYLQSFGYMRRGVPEVGNLLQGDPSKAQILEDDFRIAIRTLQEFGGIPVTGDIDEETLELMKKKRCGRPDIDFGENEDRRRRRKRFVVQGTKWHHTNITWSLSTSSPPSKLDYYGTRRVLQRALNVWQQASKLTFSERNSDDVDILVAFARRQHGDDYPFDGRGSILAHAFYPGSGRGGDAHFDDDEQWLLEPQNDDEDGTSLFAVAVHEFGHSLGLGHSSVKNALMYPWYQGIKPNFKLPEDDRNGIQQMYGPKEERIWAKIPYHSTYETPPPTTRTSTSTTTTTRPPHINHHHNKHRPGYSPNPRNPSKYPSRYPLRPNHHPEEPHHPERPHYYPDRRYYNSSEEHPRKTNVNHYPRPTETTTHPTTNRPRYPYVRPEYPVYPRRNNPSDDNPRKTYHPEKTTPKPPPPADKPDTCDTSYDAVALIRNELFIFKNRYHWRIGPHGRYNGYPMEISRMWSQLPKNLTHVDAVYERPKDKKIAFFVGRELYLFNSQYLEPGYPKPLTHLGLPSSLDKLDAAMVWGHNSKTYFYSGTMYWKFDEEEGRVELDYPRDMSMWKGVGYNIDSVFQWRDGKTYFFKGKGFWKFNDLQMRVEHERQLPSAPFWMGCPAERAGRRAPYHAPPAPGSTLRSPSAATIPRLNITTYLYTTLLLLASYIHYC